MPIFDYCCRRFSTLASLSRDFRRYAAAFRHFAASFAISSYITPFRCRFHAFSFIIFDFALFRFSRHYAAITPLALMLAAS
jgi:hypothetical protein